MYNPTECQASFKMHPLCVSIMPSGSAIKNNRIGVYTAEACHAFTVHQKIHKKTPETLVTKKVSIVLSPIWKLWRYRKE